MSHSIETHQFWSSRKGRWRSKQHEIEMEKDENPFMHKINKFWLTHKLFILRCHTSIFAMHIVVVVVIVSARLLPKASCYTALSRSFSRLCSFIESEIVCLCLVLCIFHIFFVFTLKTVIYHLSKIKEMSWARTSGMRHDVVLAERSKINKKILHFGLDAGVGCCC